MTGRVESDAIGGTGKHSLDGAADLTSAELLPTSRESRTWTARNLAALWIGMVACVPTYMLAGGLIDLGMSWWQAVMTVGLGNVIVVVPMILCGHAGARYGITFPVLARVSFGTRGAHVPSLLRGAVACGWFGIQTWIGGSAIYQLLRILGGSQQPDAAQNDLPVLGISLGELACFLAFWLLQVLVVWRGMESIKVLENWAAPVLVLMGLALLLWAVTRARGFGPMLSAPSQFGEGGAQEGRFWSVFLPGLTGMVGFWATLSLNIPDFTRFARSQRDQLWGQVLGLPPFMVLFSFVGVAVTSATVIIFGEPIADPTILLGRIGAGWGVMLALGALSLATLSTNLAANVVSPANALVNLAPSRVDFRSGALLAAGLGAAVMPWKLIESSAGYIFTWLVGYSALLGPIAGILICDYYLIRRTRLDVEGLYRHEGPYGYRGGVNVVAIVALLIGTAPNVPGFLAAAGLLDGVNGFWTGLYDYAWFLGFGLAGIIYVVGMRLSGHTPPGAFDTGASA